VLDAFGRDVIFLETIGIGQLEYRIHFSAHTTIVVFTPDAGDDVQSLKSGLMEIGDVFVVNKADRSHARRYADDLRSMLELRSSGDAWLPPVVGTVATRDEGTDELVESIEAHRSYLSHDSRMDQKRTAALRNRTTMIIEEKLKEFFWENAYIKEKLEGVLKEVFAGRKSPYEVAGEIIAPLKIEKRKGGTR
jgi:LAO/AO transport system kinase